MNKVILNLSSELQSLICKYLGVDRLPTKVPRNGFLFAKSVSLMILAVCASPVTVIFFGKEISEFGDVAQIVIVFIMFATMILSVLVCLILGTREKDNMRIFGNVRHIRNQLDFWNENEFIDEERIQKKLRDLALAQVSAEKVYESARRDTRVSREKFREIDDRRTETEFMFDRVERFCGALGIRVFRPEIFKKATEEYGKLEAIKSKRPV